MATLSPQDASRARPVKALGMCQYLHARNVATHSLVNTGRHLGRLTRRASCVCATTVLTSQTRSIPGARTSPRRTQLPMSGTAFPWQSPLTFVLDSPWRADSAHRGSRETGGTIGSTSRRTKLEDWVQAAPTSPIPPLFCAHTMRTWRREMRTRHERTLRQQAEVPEVFPRWGARRLT